MRTDSLTSPCVFASATTAYILRAHDAAALPDGPPAWQALGLALREEQAADLPALRALFRQQRSDDFAALPLDDAARQALIDQQFDAQRSDYRRRFPDMRRLVLTEHAQIVGRLYLAQAEGELRILDIALRPGHCGRGLGTMLLKAVQAHAAGHGLAVGLQVYRHNRAAALYQRLGFQPVAEGDIAWEMVWRQPAGISPTA